MAHDFSTAKHTHLQSWFNREWIRNGRIPERFGKLYNHACDFRLKTDYTDEPVIDPVQIQNMLEESKEFVVEIEQRIKEKIHQP